MKSILFIHQGKGIGGASLCLKELLDEFKYEYEITVLCIFQSDAVEYFKKSGYNTVVLNSFFYRKIYRFFYHSEAYSYTLLKPIAFFRAVISYFLNLYFAKKVISKYKPSLVHLNASVLTDWAIAAKKSKTKVIIHIREPLGKGYLGIRRKLLQMVINRYTDHAIAISNDNAQRLSLPNKTTIVYDPIRSLPVDLTKEKDDNFRYFTYLGGTQALKGFYILTEALKYLDDGIWIYFGGYFYKKNKGSGLLWRIKYICKLFIPSYRKLFRSIKIIENSEKVIILGVVDNVYNYIQQSVALLFPSTKPHFADPVLEAYKIGKPVIVSDVDGMDEIVNNKTGLFFKKSNAKSLAVAINNIAKMDKNHLDSYKNNCLQKFEHIVKHNNKVIDVINNILS